MKFKVGDKVRVRQEKALEREFGVKPNGTIKCDLVADMKRFCGQVVTIKEVHYTSYHIEEDNGKWAWTDAMLEGYAFEYGDEIEVSNNGMQWFILPYIGYLDGADFPYCVVVDYDVNNFKRGKNFATSGYKYARPLQKTRVEVEIKVNGKKVDKPLSLETAKRLGLVE